MDTGRPQFELVQPELFAAAGGQPNCWADFNGDGALDLFVGFKDALRIACIGNDDGTFVEVAADLGLADLTATRAAAWGDFDADGRPELYVGFSRGANTATNCTATTANGSRTSRTISALM